MEQQRDSETRHSGRGSACSPYRPFIATLARPCPSLAARRRRSLGRSPAASRGSPSSRDCGGGARPKPIPVLLGNHSARAGDYARIVAFTWGLRRTPPLNPIIDVHHHLDRTWNHRAAIATTQRIVDLPREEAAEAAERARRQYVFDHSCIVISVFTVLLRQQLGWANDCASQCGCDDDGLCRSSSVMGSR